jgi:Uma2 family endonuclease
MPETRLDVMTAEELLLFDLPGKSTELVRGRLIVREPPGTYHGQVAAKLLVLIGHHVYANSLGVVCSQDTGFKIASDPDTVRAADVAFVSKGRQHMIPKSGYAELAPDFVVEVISPGDRPGEILTKVGDWLDAGVRLVWVIDPIRRDARTYRADGSQGAVESDGALDGEDVVPGFSCRLADCFD